MPVTLRAQDFWYLAPEILLTIWGLIVLTVDFAALGRASSRTRRLVLGGLSLLGAATTLVVALMPYWTGAKTLASLGMDDLSGEPYLFFGSIAGDAVTIWFNAILSAMLLLVVGLSMAWDFTEHWGEYFALLFWATVGMMVLLAAEEILVLFLSLEMMTICLYLMTSLEKSRRRSAEGGLKYFVYGSVSSALFLFGLSLLYGMVGSTRLEAIRNVLTASDPASGLAGNVAGATAVLLILVGFGFKVAAVPFHQWAPDAYEGAPAPVASWIATGSKVASFIAMLKVLVYALAPWAHREGGLVGPGWIGVVAILSAASMTYGNFAALAQTNLKRLLAYSSIAHAGYLLVGVLAASVSVNRAQGAAGAVLFYLVIYSVSNLGAFALAAWLARDRGSEEIEDLNGLAYRAPGLAVCVVLLMLSLIGMPPLAGFFGKLSMFMEALNTGERGKLTLLWLVALGLLNSMISAFYYVRILRAMFLREPDRRPVRAATPAISWPIAAATVVVVLCGLRPGLLLEPMNQIAVSMLSTSGRTSGPGAIPSVSGPVPTVALDPILPAPTAGGG